MARELGSDVSFFLSGFLSANVSGTGEAIAEFNDIIPRLEFKLSDIFCSTPLVYKEFDRLYAADLNAKFKQNLTLSHELLKLTSKQLLEGFESALLNDLYAPCISLYPQMQANLDKGYFLSGSGSACFKIKK